jgi:hypothetical protein
VSIGHDRTSVEDEPYGTPEARIPDILALTEGNLPIRIDEFNERIVIAASYLPCFQHV